MKKRKIVIVYKKSTLDLYDSVESVRNLKKQHAGYYQIMKRSHDDHNRSLEVIQDELTKLHHEVILHSRGDNRFPELTDKDLVLSLGGDGTFIYASHQMNKGKILGINSAPDSSIGHYCRNNLYDRNWSLIKTIGEILDDRIKPSEIYRLEVKVNKKKLIVPVINDILIMDENPAMTSRYSLQLEGEVHFQKSSGIWISTATGSTAAFSSAGGKRFSQRNEKGELQFGVAIRELYGKSSLKKPVFFISESDTFSIDSGMIHGLMYFDGGQLSQPFTIGDRIEIGFQKKPLLAFISSKVGKLL